MNPAVLELNKRVTILEETIKENWAAFEKRQAVSISTVLSSRRVVSEMAHKTGGVSDSSGRD